MPRFLNTYTGEFVWIAEIGATPYAILSHTWRSDEEGGEQTYDDIVKLQTECPAANPIPWNDETTPPVNDAFFSHPNLSDKIKRACQVARNTRFRLIWIDSCCIEKRSSAELSEAINLMYALYRDADVCFVYLADVPRGTDPRARRSEFWVSRWHKRGWTLQELVAPPYVIFLTCDWTFLGTKTGLASTLKKITGVDAAILLGMKPIESASVAKRMSWAALRETTRVEDQAYSLLGIFGVHMSPIYGEGTNAFLRLQEEIIKHIPDQSIFAWGRSLTLLAPDKVAHGSRGPWGEIGPGLLAPSPDAFWDVGDVIPITPFKFAMCMGRRPPPLHCIFTPQGARIELVTIPLPPDTVRMLNDIFDVACNTCREAMFACSPFQCLALLPCTDRDGHLIALPLRCPEEDVGAAENVAIGFRETCGASWHTSPRVLRLSATVLKDLNDVAPTCVEVSLLRHWQKPVLPKAHRIGFSKRPSYPLWMWEKGEEAPEIRLAPNCEEELGAVGFTLTPLVAESRQHPENTCPADVFLSTTLSMHSATQQPPDDDQHTSPPMLIQLELQRPEDDEFSCCFSVVCVPMSSAIESVHPAYPAADDVSSRTSPHNDSCSTPHMTDNRQSRSFDLTWFPSCTIAETEFIIPDCTVSRTHANGSSMDYVRLLRLKLENPLESAYTTNSDYFSFSVELSEPFLNCIASTQSQAESAATSTGSAPSQHLADYSLIQATPDGSSRDSEATPLPPPHPDTTHDSPDPILFSTTTSEQTAVCERSGAPPGPCDSAVQNDMIDDTPRQVCSVHLSPCPSPCRF
ncbi:heterokaryon incompatibility protein-domain-containing protein [Lenzites betulinus]|nr:heterokaryon incompatibility protein-domain-containing protein [Lenzites betulinus]